MPESDTVDATGGVRLEDASTDEMTAGAAEAPGTPAVRARSRTRAHIWAGLLVAVALISIFVLARVASSPSTLSGVRDSLDSQQATVSALAAGSTALSAGLSLVPGDALTPVANQLADVSGWLMVIIAAIILQKILVTVSGTIAFIVVIPLACALGIVYVYSTRTAFRSLALKLAAFGAVLFLAVPGSIVVSDLLTRTYTETAAAASVADQAADDAADADGETGEPADPAPDDGDGSLLDTIGDWLAGAVDSVGNFVEGAVDSIEDIKDDAVDALNGYMEKFALLVVTTCIMPVLVMLLFAWVIKMLFSIDIRVASVGRAVQAQGSRGVKMASQGVARAAKKTPSG